MLYSNRLPRDVSNWLGDLSFPSHLIIWSLEWLSLWDGCVGRWALMSGSFPITKGKNAIPVYYCLVSLEWGSLPDSNQLLGNDNLSFWTSKDWLRRRGQTGITQLKYFLLWQGQGLAAFSVTHNWSHYTAWWRWELTMKCPTHASSIWHTINKICYMIILSRCSQIFHPGLNLGRALEVVWR